MNPRTLAVPALAALLTFVPTLAAQPVTPAQQPPAETPTVNVDFRGGTLLELVVLLRGQNNMVNIVAPELASRVPLPPMQLRSVTAESALRAASTVMERPFDLNVQSIAQQGGGSVLALRVQERITRASGGMAGMVESDDPQVEVFSLRAITKALPGEPEGIAHRTTTVLTAIDTGLGFVQSSSKPSIKFHEDSGLLFVSATYDQRQLVRSVLSQLEISVATARAEAARAAAAASTQAQMQIQKQDAKADPGNKPK